MSSKRPDRTTMPGMIWNANHVLDQALSPKTNGVPRSMFGQCKGILLLSVVEAGFVFTGNVGTGILLAKNKEGKWSPPCAMGLTGVGWGFIAGASMRDLLVFLFDENALNAIAAGGSLKIGGQASATLGPMGRDVTGDINLSDKGIGASMSFCFSKGAFGGISIEGAVVAPRIAVNETYYGRDLAPKQILYDPMENVPEDPLMPEIYKKLELLMAGQTAEPTAEETAKVEAARVEAEKAGEAAQKDPDVEFVDAAAKASE